ncbi:MAG: dihydroflavonol 4-reductase, partial [Clostridiales bacterium]|nr:dihydroflavonol 4-reductase [Clostridiales bacterium]
MVAAIEHGENGEGYILASHYVTIREIFDSLHKLTGGREIKVMIPLWLVRLLTPLIALYYKL